VVNEHTFSNHQKKLQEKKSDNENSEIIAGYVQQQAYAVKHWIYLFMMIKQLKN
jgi:predicted Zn-dependent peptidase